MILVGIALGVFVSLVGVNLNNQAQDKKLEKQVKEALTREQPESVDEFKQSYMEGCLGEDSNFSYCDCTYETLKQKLGMDEFVKLAIKYADDEIIPDEFVDAAIECIDEQ